MQFLKDIKNARRVAKQWHIEMVIIIPWLIWFSIQIYKIRVAIEAL